VVRELGLERRETVRSLSTVTLKAMLVCAVVREEPVHLGSGGPVVFFACWVANLTSSNRWKQLKREVCQWRLLWAFAR
jgi:hypothetical protein